MIIDCIGCLHGYFPELDGGDLLIIAGDLTARHTPLETVYFLEWLSKQKYKKIIFISGNHDTQLVEKDDYEVFFDGKIFNLEWPKHIEYLCDSGIEVITDCNRLKVWGSPWTLKFQGINPKCMAFTCDNDYELDSKFSLIPEDTDILITHGPMRHILDTNRDGYACGSSLLRKHIDRVKPRLHVFGHIHEQGGNQLMYKHSGQNTWCINCSIMNEKYKPVNKPVRIDM